MSLSRFLRLLVATFVLSLSLFHCSSSSAQITNVTNDQATPTPGVGHNYIGDLSEIVSPANGSVSLRISLLVPHGRQLSLPFSVAYNSNGIVRLDGSSSQVTARSSADGSFASLNGWSYSLPTLSETTINIPGVGHPGFCQVYTSFVFAGPSGSRQAQNNLALADLVECNAVGVSPQTSYSSSGQHYQSWVQNGATSLNVPFYVQDASGTLYHFPLVGSEQGCVQPCGAPDYIEDRNGNKIIYAYGTNGFPVTVTDTLDRTALSISSFGATAGDSITIPGQPAYAVAWESTPYNFTIGGTSLNPSSCPFGTPSSSGSIQVIQSITLPNRKTYQFFYDSTYGFLKEILYPTGAWVKYDWATNQASDIVSWKDSNGNANGCSAHYNAPALLHRYVSYDGTNTALQQDFSYSTLWQPNGFTWQNKTTTVTSTDYTQPAHPSFQTVYVYSPYLVPNPLDINSNIANQVPLEQTITYKDWNGAVLKTVTKTWNGPDLLLSQQTTLGDPQTGQTAKTAYMYDGLDVLHETDEYDFAAGAPGPLLRKTVVSHQGFSATPLGVQIYDRPCKNIISDGNGNTVAETDYYYDGSTTLCGTLGSAVATGGPSGFTSHDEVTFSTGATTPRGNATTVIKQCFQGSTACASGNSKTTYTYDETGQMLSATDACGNVACSDVSGTGHTTTFSYTNSHTVLSNGQNVSYSPTCPPSDSPCNTNAFLTKITNPLGQTNQFSYDYNNGQLTVSTDANSQTTKYLYNDPFARPTLVNYPDGGSTQTCYTDAGGAICTQASAPPFQVVAQKAVSSGTTISTTSILDGMGRVTQTQLTTDPDGTTYTDTTYDGSGRVRTQSNPHRSTSLPSDGTTTNYYDALGRNCLVVPPDGTLPAGNGCPTPTSQPSSTVLTTYSGNTTTVTDQAGKSRESVTDGLGRLTTVFEDPAGVNYRTDYAYDALNNLARVDQWGGAQGNSGDRVRRFNYDSLSHLVCASNPETSSAACPATASGSYTTGTTGYTYDANGNLATKTSLKPNQTSTATVVASYTYDALDRLTQKSFNDGTTPTVKYGYDSVALTGCTTAPPTLTDSNPIGNRTAMCDGAGAESWSHDSMGRALVDKRTTNSIIRNTGYTYNLDGSPLTVAYPSTTSPPPVTVNYTQGGAGRLLSENASFNMAYSAHYAPNGSLCSISSLWGQMFRHDYTFNNRFQVTAIQDWDTYNMPAHAVCTTTTPSGNGSDELDLAYSYVDASGHNNGNVIQITNNLDTHRTQLFSYDSLNRLSTANTLTTNQPMWQGDTGALPNCWAEQYSYDPWGNLTVIAPFSSSSYTGCSQESGFNFANGGINTKNQIAISGYGYDAAGNLTSAPPTGNTYVYDAENHLTSAGGVAYLYDGDGKRVGKAPASSPTQPNYIYWYGGESEILQETDGAGNVQYNDFYFNGVRFDRQESDNFEDHFFADALGNSRCVYGDTDPDGGCSDYYPFGGERPLPSYNGVNVPFKFTGKERDPESGLDNFGARYDSSSLGRFMSPDWSVAPMGVPYADLGSPQSLNLYSYVKNNPVTFTDPDGHCDVDGEHHWGWCVWHRIGLYQTKKEVAAEEAASAKARADFEAFRRREVAAGRPDPMVMYAFMGMFAGAMGGFGPLVEPEPSTGGTGAPQEPTGSNATKAWKSGLQAEEVQSGSGAPVAGGATGTTLRDAARLAAIYGGQEADWVKVTSSSAGASGGQGTWAQTGYSKSGFEIHAYQNVKTGQVVELKTVFPTPPAQK